MNETEEPVDKQENEDDDRSTSSSSSSEDEEKIGEQVRVSFTLAKDCTDRTLEVTSQPIAVPASLSRSGLSAVLNHLLGRGETDESDEEATSSARPIPFEFVITSQSNKSNKLLRTGIEREARRRGVSLEEAIPVTYFPAMPTPELVHEDDQRLPDWISAMSYLSHCATHGVYSDQHIDGLLCTGGYDGSLHCFVTGGDTKQSQRTVGLRNVAERSVHGGAIKCMSTSRTSTDKQTDVWIATGAMDHTLALHQLTKNSVADDNDDNLSSAYNLSLYAMCKHGHAASVESVDITSNLLASGDWDGGLCIWKFGDPNLQPEQDEEEQQKQPSKKSKGTKSKGSSALSTTSPYISPQISMIAHASKVSGVSFGNHLKLSSSPSAPETIITSSWDHSLKVWNIDRQDCLMTLNGSRVVSCLDTSYHSPGIAATGHPDCTVRLWDVRSAVSSKLAFKDVAVAVADKTFRPSHNGWISDVRWSRESPYHLSSSSHDGTVKFWDIRSSIPLYTVRAFEKKKEKALCLSYGDDGLLFSGGTDCIVKQFRVRGEGASPETVA